MLEAQLNQGVILKKLIEAVKDFINEANIECTSSGIQLQAMEENHVTLVQFLLRSEGFDTFRCDRTLCLGINIGSLSKILKCSGNDDSTLIKASDNGDIVNLFFSSPDGSKNSEFDLKLMSLNHQSLNIPETVYNAVVTLSSGEFQKICRDLSMLSETVTISVQKDGVKFFAEGDIGSGSITLNTMSSADSEQKTAIQLLKPVTTALSLKHLLMYTKATPLSEQVKLSISSEYPSIIEYSLNDAGYLKFYLAPKIDDE